MAEQLVSLAHPRFSFVDAQIFTRRVVADCMSHSCKIVKLESPGSAGARSTADGRRGASITEVRPMLDACCQYGADVDLGERPKIEARAGEIRALLRADAKDVPWFDSATGDFTADADAPSGGWYRTATHGGGCVFLAHDKRGCAIHRASIENDWDFRGTKPHICRLFPLSYTTTAIVVSEDYADYSCAYRDDAPTLYRVGRDTLGDVFGAELVAALDAVERSSENR